MLTTCNCFKHKINDINYTAFTVILIKNMNKQKKSYNDHCKSCVPVFYFTLQFQSQMSMPSWCKFTTAIWCVMRKRASPCWLQLCTVGSYHPPPLRDARSSRRILRVRRAPRQSLRSVPTYVLHNTVMVCLQQLALLAPTLRPTRLQQSVSTASRRRNCRGVGWLVALLTAVFDRNNVLAAYLRAKSRYQCCRSHNSLKQYLCIVTV